MNEELNKYELMVIFSGELTEAAFEKELGELRKMLQETTAGIIFEESMGRLALAFRIKKQNFGYYVIFNFNAAPKVMAELRNTIKLNQAVLRSLFLAVPADYDAGRYKEMVLPERERARDDKKRTTRLEPGMPAVSPMTAPAPALKTAAKQEEELKTVEKKLEKILENPDIDIK